MNYTGITFIICHRDEENLTKTISSIHDSFVAIKPSNRNYEIITVRGNHPSLQRNIAVDYATFSHIYFLDNDSLIERKTIEHVVTKLTSSSEEAIDILGGPSILSKEASYFEICADGVLTNYLAIGRRSARYYQAGMVKESDGKDLILCNMVVNKKCFISSGRFNFHLYPNEENEFIERVYKSSGRIVYDPEMYVYRHQRESYTAFIKQMFNYGRGKAEELKIELSKYKLLGIRLLVGLILLLLIGVFNSEFLMFMNTVESTSYSIVNFISFLWPHLVFWYSIYVLWLWVKTATLKKKMLFHFPILLPLCHFFYFFGLVFFLFKKKYYSDNKTIWFKITKAYTSVR